jgi:mannose-6-phosphate isomerase-like protein (cupin superfamily)
VQVYELSAAAVARMVPVDLATLEDEPPSPIGHFEFHGCACGVASFVGQPPWEMHNSGDELLHILAGQCELTVLSKDTEEIRQLKAGDIVLVPQGSWHRNRTSTGVTMLFMTPRGGGEHTWEDPRRQPEYKSGTT